MSKIQLHIYLIFSCVKQNELRAFTKRNFLVIFIWLVDILRLKSKDITYNIT